MSLNCCSIISAKLVVHLICWSSCNSLFFGRFACDKPCSYDEGGPQTIEIFSKMSMLIRTGIVLVVMYLCIHLEIFFFCASSGGKGFIISVK